MLSEIEETGKLSIARKAAKEGIWLAAFRFIGQFFSWAITIIIARILVPEDYGLMEMATILTGYVAIFSELGLGSAIIQRERITDEELSSLFWFIVFWGFILALICIALAYPTAYIFGEPKTLKVTQTVSFLFIVGSFLIVPRTILQRDFRFKAIGLIDTLSIIISSLSMLLIAKLGGGVWTLIGGHITRELIKTIITFKVLRWRPKLRFNFRQIKGYLKFGLNLAGSSSLYYISSKSDRFFGGRSLGANGIGYYSLALELASIPNEKLVSLINSVSFPVFSRYQKKKDEFNQFYLKLIKVIAFIAFPLYIGGILVADELIPLFLSTKWIPLIFPFKLLCVAQIIISITAPNANANNAQGRPHWVLYITVIYSILMPISFYVSSKFGLNALAIPWITIYPLIRGGFAWVTMRKLGIPVSEYLRNIMHPAIATAGMAVAILLVKYLYFNNFSALFPNLWIYLLSAILTGVTIYLVFLTTFQRPLLTSLLNLRKE
jgi:O-antigen/teichoic acid export membrane protein